MSSIAEKLDAVYEKYGGKAIYPPLFIFFLMLHIVTSLGLNYPAADPNELSVIAAGEWFVGKNWSGVMCSVNYYYGFIQGLIYAPALLIFNDAQTQYTAMLVINAVLISFVPPLAFSCSRRLGVRRVWQALLTAMAAGGYCSYFAHTKFAWSETSAIVFPWLFLWLLMRSEELRSKPARVLLSLLIGFCCAVSLGAHVRLIAVVLAIYAALIAQRIFYKKSAVPILPFTISFVAFSVLIAMFSLGIQRSLWMRSDPAELGNTAENFILQIGEGFAAENGVLRFIQTLFSQLYYFAAATWGAGAIAVCLFCSILSRRIREKKSGETQESERSLTGFAFFAFFSVIFIILTGTFYRFGSDALSAYQDAALFGRFLDGVIPFALMFVLVILFRQSIELKTLLQSAAVLIGVYLAFFVVSLPLILECGATRISPVVALYPLQIGAEGGSLLSFESLLLSASVTLCVTALFIVITSCTKALRPPLISAVFAVITVYSIIFLQSGYVPLCRRESYEKNTKIAEISESVYNQNGAPTLTAYNLSRHEALMLQFLNQNVTVRITYDIGAIPENCFLAVKSGEDVSALADGMSPFLLVADNSSLRLYAYGERAIAYMQSQDIGENEDESLPLITEKPASDTIESVSAPPETTTASTTPPDTERTTERTPVISTQTTPAVITVPADNLGTDDEWAIIE